MKRLNLLTLFIFALSACGDDSTFADGSGSGSGAGTGGGDSQTSALDPTYGTGGNDAGFQDGDGDGDSGTSAGDLRRRRDSGTSVGSTTSDLTTSGPDGLPPWDLTTSGDDGSPPWDLTTGGSEETGGDSYDPHKSAETGNITDSSDKGSDTGCTNDGDGCVKTQGFWENHQDSWPECAVGNTLCGTPWVYWLETPPGEGEFGEHWTLLAHQFITTELNLLSGVVASRTVRDSAEEAQSLLGRCEPVLEPTNASSLAETLDSFNDSEQGC